MPPLAIRQLPCFHRKRPHGVRLRQQLKQLSCLIPCSRRDSLENANLVTNIDGSFVAAHSGPAIGNFWDSFTAEGAAGSDSSPQFPSFDAWLIQFSSGFLSNLTQLAREAIPADIAHLLPTQPVHLPPASAASSSEANTQAAERAAQGFQEAFANSSLARDPHSQSLPPTGCLSASHIRAIKKKEDELEEIRSLSPAGVVHFLFTNLSPSSTAAAEFRNIQRPPWMLAERQPVGGKDWEWGSLASDEFAKAS